MAEQSAFSFRKEDMRKLIKITKQTIVVYDRSDAEDIRNAKESFKEPYGKAKEALKQNPKDYDAKVDVCFYRLLFKKLNKILFVLKGKGEYREKPTIEIEKAVEEARFNRRSAAKTI